MVGHDEVYIGVYIGILGDEFGPPALDHSAGVVCEHFALPDASEETCSVMGANCDEIGCRG